MIDAGPFQRYVDHVNEKGCWVTWLAPNGSGYGTVWLGTKAATRRKVGLHVAAYLHFVGEVPEGHVLDHAVCQNRLCFNPGHLEPVTTLENVLRANRHFQDEPYACGHPRTEANSLRNGRNRSGQTYRCAICNRSRKTRQVVTIGGR